MPIDEFRQHFENADGAFSCFFFFFNAVVFSWCVLHGRVSLSFVFEIGGRGGNNMPGDWTKKMASSALLLSLLKCGSDCGICQLSLERVCRLLERALQKGVGGKQMAEPCTERRCGSSSPVVRERTHSPICRWSSGTAREFSRHIRSVWRGCEDTLHV